MVTFAVDEPEDVAKHQDALRAAVPILHHIAPGAPVPAKQDWAAGYTAREMRLAASPPAPATPLVVVRDAWPTLPADAWAATEPQRKSGFQHSTVSSKLRCVRGKIPRPERQYFEVEPAALLG